VNLNAADGDQGADRNLRMLVQALASDAETVKSLDLSAQDAETLHRLRALGYLGGDG
jgi:hypothetical protein